MRAALFLAVLFLAGPALADNDPNRPTDRIATDLGIEEAVFIECFKPVNPEPGKYPSGARQRANKAILLPCLQRANAAITNDRLDAVMDKYRPEGAFRNTDCSRKAAKPPVMRRCVFLKVD
jgi:hypothetical protein